MESDKQKDVRVQELVIEPKKAYYEKVEPIRFKLRKTRCVDLDDNLKRIYRIKN